jgi:hypothetical protein
MVDKIDFSENSKLWQQFFKNDDALISQLVGENAIEVNLMNLINKVSKRIFSDLGEIEYSVVRNEVANKIVEKVKSLHLIDAGFDFKTANGNSILERTSKNLAMLKSRMISHTDITLDRSIARRYLPAYRNQLSKLTKKKAVFERLAKTSKSPQATKQLKELNIKIEGYKHTIEQIQGSDLKTVNKSVNIIIMFPPADNVEDLQKLPSILNITDYSVKTRDGFLYLQRQWRKYNSIQKTLVSMALRAVKQIQTINDMGGLIIVLNSFDNQTNAKLVEQIMHNLIASFQVHPIKVPLDPETKKLVNTILAFYGYLDLRRGASAYLQPLFFEVTDILPIPKLKKLLRDSENTANYELMHRKKHVLSDNKILTLGEDRFLKAFDNLVIKKNKLSIEELKFVAMMLEKSIGDKKFNKKIEKLLKENKAAKAYSYAIDDLKYFSFKTEFANSFEDLIIKCRHALKAVKEGRELNSKDQISLFEFGRLEDIAKLRAKLEEYNELGIISQSKKLQALYQNTIKADELINDIQDIFNKEAIYKNGDILMTESKLSLITKNKSADFESFLTQNFISKYSHAMQVYIDPETKKAKLSHIYGGYQSDDVLYSSVITANAFRVDVFKLISPALQSKLKVLYAKEGKDFKVEINKLFHENIQKLHANSQARFQELQNDKPQRFRAGLADFGLSGGHHRSDATDRHKVRDAMYERNGYKIKNKMICSEFVARSTLAALFETNELLIAELNKKDPANKIKTVVDMPLKKERLQRMHPERLIRLLWKQGCLERIDPPAIVTALINPSSELQINPQKRKVKLASAEILYNKLVKLSKQHTDVNSFISQGIKAIKIYAKSENININFKSDSVYSVLHTDLKHIYRDLTKSPPSTYFKKFVAWLSELGAHLGFRKSTKFSSVFLQDKMDKLEKAQYKATKREYRGESDPVTNFEVHKFPARGRRH